MKTKPSRADAVQPRLRIMFGQDIAMGPGKARLLRLIQETGSISEAARQMEMSYMRAWSLIRTMNGCFREPVVATTRGGKQQGGAQLTATGERLVHLFERLENEFLKSTKTTRKAITALLKAG